MPINGPWKIIGTRCLAAPKIDVHSCYEFFFPLGQHSENIHRLCCVTMLVNACPCIVHSNQAFAYQRGRGVK